MADAIEHRRLAAIMFTDMVAYSALAQHDEALAGHSPQGIVRTKGRVD
jgi:class 3 adenylate cyclase